MTAARKAVIDSEGVVVNIIIADDTFDPGEGLTLRDATDDDRIAPPVEDE